MAEISTIARPYAEAIYRVAKQGDLERWAGWLSTMAEVAANPEMAQVIGDPKLDHGQLYDLFVGVTGLSLDDAGRNFVRALIENDRLLALPEIASQFHALKNAGAGMADAHIYSAFPLSEAQVADLVKVLERKFAVKINPSVTLDESLIGGVRVVVNDEVLDSSVRTRLEAMRVALTA